ncbi:MAG: tol-pal system YbgF family protein [Bacteriovoracia bacterium]
MYIEAMHPPALRNFAVSLSLFLIFHSSLGHCSEVSVQNKNTIANQQETRQRDLRAALKYFQEKKYTEALTFLNRAMKGGADTESVFLRGMIYFRLRAFERAKKDFELVLKYSHDPGLVEDCHYFIANIEQEDQEGPLPYYLYLDVALGRNDNINSNAKSESNQINAAEQTIVGGGYHFFSNNPLSFKLNYSLYHGEALGIVENRFIAHTVQIPLIASYQGWAFETTPGLRYQFLGNSSYERDQEVKFSLKKSVGNSEYGGSYTVLHRNPGNTDYYYLLGYAHNRSIYWLYGQSNYYFKLSMNDNWENTGDQYEYYGILPNATHNLGPGVEGTFSLPYNFEFSVYASYLFKKYKNASGYDGIFRQDEMLYADVKIAYKVLSKLKVYVAVNYLKNYSTLDATQVADRNYNQTIFWTGISSDFLP